MNHDDSSDGGQQQQPRGPFDVDEDRAFDALTFAWGDEYGEFWHDASGWGACRNDAAGGGEVTGATPDELNRAIRADSARRGAL